MKPTNTRSIWRLIRPDPLAAIALVGSIGRVYVVAELPEQPPDPPRLTGTRQPTLREGETLLQELLRLKLEGYRHRHV